MPPLKVGQRFQYISGYGRKRLIGEILLVHEPTGHVSIKIVQIQDWFGILIGTIYNDEHMDSDFWTYLEGQDSPT